MSSSTTSTNATAYGTMLWEPSPARQDASHLRRFMSFLEGRHGVALTDYPSLHRWSVTHTEAFWGALAEFAGVRWLTPPDATWTPPPAGRMRGARWFPGARLNFADNLLPPPSDAVAVIAHAEGQPRRTLTAAELRREVSRCAQALRAAGVGSGDRVAGVIANGPEALVAMLATASLGGVWASCSPDFGAAAVVDRLGQVAPKVVVYTGRYQYAGKTFDCAATIADVSARLPGAPKAVVVGGGSAVGTVAWNDFLAPYDGTAPIAFAPMPFDAPLYVLFSSGTTGVPKCITHGVGGTLLQHKKELLLHADVGPGSRLFYYTTCGWMMWNWMASALATGASLVVYDGAVTHPDIGALWRLVADEGVTAFGTSPKFVAACMAAGYSPRAALARHAPRTILSTGSPLLPEQFRWLYDEAGGPQGDLHLASISGGTDIVSCFMLGNPLMPVRAGEIQYAGLGMAIDAWDDAGQPVRGAKGELVCTRPFPAMPVMFWNDADGAKYTKAYFAHFTGDGGAEVWRHGDFIEIGAHGGIVVYGRSDATLNPGGVRIGTAELYRQIEALPEVLDSIAVGRKDADGDEAIVLFVKLRPGLTLDDALRQRIRGAIRANLTPRHVPKDVLQVRDVPYTRSGKKVEIAVTQAIHGEPVSNLAALANPEAMDEFFALGAART